MEITTTQINHFSGLLSAELQCAEKLLTLLGHEHQALTGSDPDRIIALSEQKQSLVEQMQQQLANRQGFLTRLGLPGDREGVDTLLNAHPKVGNALALWQQLMEIATQLSNQNQVNGGIITLGHRHVRQTLCILTGNNGNNDTYGPKGNRDESASRSLAKA
ncbi:MAG: flagellar protein FlgN [Candidatus Sedimenticola sp. (ex Thyasira tokunagai)]